MIDHAYQTDEKWQSHQATQRNRLSDVPVRTDRISLSDELPAEIPNIHLLDLVVPHRCTTGCNRNITILLAVEIAHQLGRGIGMVFVDRRPQPGTHIECRIGRIADGHQHDPHQQRIEHALVLPRRPDDAPEEGQNQDAQRRERVVAQNPGDPLHHHRIDHAESRGGAGAPEKKGVYVLLALSKKEDEKERRDSENIQQVHARGKTDEVGDQKQNSVAAPFVRAFDPDENKPDDDRREKHRPGIHFGFNGVKPEGIGKREAQGPNHAADVHGQSLFKIFRQATPGAQKPHDDQIGEHHGQRADQNGDHVHAKADILDKRNHREDPTEENEKRRARRVRHSHDVGAGDEFTAIPVGSCRRNRGVIHQESDTKNHRRNNSIQFTMFHEKLASP